MSLCRLHFPDLCEGQSKGSFLTWLWSLQILHDLWRSEGFSSKTYNRTQLLTYPLALEVAENMRKHSPYRLGFGNFLGHKTSTPLLLKICNQNQIPTGGDALYNASKADIMTHWRQVCPHDIQTNAS